MEVGGDGDRLTSLARSVLAVRDGAWKHKPQRKDPIWGFVVPIPTEWDAAEEDLGEFQDTQKRKTRCQSNEERVACWICLASTGKLDRIPGLTQKELQKVRENLHKCYGTEDDLRPVGDHEIAKRARKVPKNKWDARELGHFTAVHGGQPIKRHVATLHEELYQRVVGLAPNSNSNTNCGNNSRGNDSDAQFDKDVPCIDGIDSDVKDDEPVAKRIHIDPMTKLASPADDDAVRIFCNRSLNMASISAVGFDMDYTLAQYKPETFEKLVYKLMLGKLVKDFGYPRLIEKLKFNWEYMMRGLTIDMKRGNVLKLDRHKFVKLAYHGFRKLSREERHQYHATETIDSFDDPHVYAHIDTLFSLGESYLFVQLVDLKDSKTNLGILAQKTYKELYSDIRKSVDTCHRDGSLKRHVARDPGKYIYKDANLVPLLQDIRSSGKKTFIATNSLWDYTHIVMNYLIDDKVGAEKDLAWLKYFDVVIVGSAKPKFFQASQAMFQIQTDTGCLLNTDQGNPMMSLESESEMSEPTPSYQQGKVFQGGNYKILNRMLGTESNSSILYVGDHIYGDILKSKKTLGWRTMLVVPEMKNEVQALNRNKGTAEDLFQIRKQKERIQDEVQRIRWRKHVEVDIESTASMPRDEGQNRDPSGNCKRDASEVDALERELSVLSREHRLQLHKYHSDFHPIWGQFLKTGYQNSRFACQMERFACLYTSEVGNLMYYSPNKSYRALQDEMPHDAILG